MLAPLLLLLACVTPDPAPVSSEAVMPSMPSKPPQPGSRSVADSPIPAGATEMPSDLVCQGDRGGWGCFKQMPGGRFLLGAQAVDASAPRYDERAAPEEAPVHEVVLSPYWIQAYPTSASEFRRCVKTGQCKEDDAIIEGPFTTYGAKGEGSLPIVGITWDGAQAYCGWLGGRLPTEAEWEAAARGAEGRRFAWGNKVLCPTEDEIRGTPGSGITPSADLPEACSTLLGGVAKQLSAIERNGASKALLGLPAAEAASLCKEVVELPYDARAERLRGALHLGGGDADPTPACINPNLRGTGDIRVGTPEGLFGLGGHVWEWTLDGYGPYADSTLTDPQGAQGVEERVQRGGSYLSPDPFAWRGAVRVGMTKDAMLPDVGFRCVWTGDRK